MVDPVTAVTGAIAGIKMANTAFGVIKQAIQNGREVTDCASALSKWVAGCSAVQKEHSEKTSRLGSSASERAVETLVHIQTIQRQRDELREFLQLYGRAGSWDQFLALEREYRVQAKKERDDAIRAKAKRGEKIKNIVAASLIVAFVAILIGIGLIIYLNIPTETT